MKIGILLAFILLLASASAVVKIVSPIDVAVYPLEEIDIRPVGPGHEVVLQFQRETDESIYWDFIRLKNKVDEDWEISSSLDDKYLYYHIKVPSNKTASMNPFSLQIIDKESLIRSEEAEIKIYVTRDPNDLLEVLDFEEEPQLYAGEEGYAVFKIRNKALSVAVYNVSVHVEDLPSASGRYEISLQPAETKGVSIPLTIYNEKVYIVSAIVRSDDNPAINEKITTKAYVRPTLQSKFRNISQGFPMMPLTMTPFYAVLGLLGF